VIDEDDFRSRCREMAEAFGGADRVHYASKAFLCTETARWVAEEGLSMDVASGGELAVALRADFPPARITMHGTRCPRYVSSTASLGRRAWSKTSSSA
jgi:diaminopimelate decarboxylase